MSRKTDLKIKRVYEKPSSSDGNRILVDRTWPRGVSKARAKLDLWLKEISPSVALRRRCAPKDKHWKAFRNGYFKELDKNTQAVDIIRGYLDDGPVTLIYSARDEVHNQAVLLLEYLQTH